jgi:hypothetical protein
MVQSIPVRSISQSGRKSTQLAIATFGILLPYLARLPGVVIRGSKWLTQMTDSGVEGFVFIGLFNAALWGSVLAATASYRHLRPYVVPLILGFSLPLYAYAHIDLASSSTAALAFVFIPLESLPLVFIGFYVGRWYDRRLSRERPTDSR